MNLKHLVLIEVLAPLLGSIIAGMFGQLIGRKASHRTTIVLMLVSFLCAILAFKAVVFDKQQYLGNLYTWAVSGRFAFHLGFMIDALTTVMMLVVTFVSLLVHIYSMAYMEGDPGYQRFFSYVSLFTFSMLMLVTANNFLQLFFGWEAVGLVSYLLIGFWFEKDAAIEGNLKAFLVNRVGDFGFILGIALVLVTVGSLDYDTVFAQANLFVNSQYHLFPNTSCTTVSLVCVLLFIGAMGKSAQMPLHVWLPESMQGPTPISALIHAATMVTAGVFMVARLSPLYELSQPALSLILMIGASGALYLGLLAFVSYDIKRIIAYSTMSQLGYMMAANGASAFQAGIFHLVTHACFKALLFLAAGSVMLMTKDEHDIRQLGGLRKYMPITYVTFLLGALSLSAIPPFSGFYSKDAIIDAVHVSSIPGAQYAYVCLLIGSFVTAFYIFREFFMVFHGQERMSADVKIQLREAPLAITAPLMLLAIPSVLLGAFLVYPTWYQFPGLADYRALTVFSLPVGLACGGIFSAWIWVLACPALARWTEEHFKLFQWMLKKQYGFDAFNDFVFVKGGRRLSEWLYHYIDITLIDTWFVDGTGREVVWLSRLLRRLQSGYVYHYVFVMIIGLVSFLVWMFFWK